MGAIIGPAGYGHTAKPQDSDSESNDNLISRKEAARIIGVSGTMIDKYVSLGLLENVGDSGRYARPRFRLSEVASFERPKRGARRKY